MNRRPKLIILVAWLSIFAMAAAGVFFAWFAEYPAAIGNALVVLFGVVMLRRDVWRWWTGREFERSAPSPKEAAQPEASSSDFVDSDAPWTIHCWVNDSSGWRTISKELRSGDTLVPNQLQEAALDVLRGTFKGTGMFNPAGAPFSGQTIDDVKIELASSVGTSFGLNPETGELDPIAKTSTRDGVTKVELVEGPALEAAKAERLKAFQSSLNGGEPVKLADVYDALGLKMPTNGNERSAYSERSAYLEKIRDDFLEKGRDGVRDYPQIDVYAALIDSSFNEQEWRGCGCFDLPPRKFFPNGGLR